MFSTLLSAALAATLAAGDASLPAPAQLNYHGSVQRRDEEPNGKSRKAFDLALWVVKSDDAGAEVYWLVDERGHGEWPWPERFGRLMLDSKWRTSAAGPALLYDRGEGRSVVTIFLPLQTFAEPLAANASWEEEKLEYLVERSTKKGDRAVWQVAVRDGFGPKRTVWMDQKSPLVASLSERMMMGRGEEFELRLELDGSEPLAAEQAGKIAAAFQSLLSLRGKLGQSARSQEIDWKPKQLETLREQLPAVATAAAGTPLEKLVTNAQRDMSLQSGRTTAVADQSSKIVGQSVEPFSVKSLAGEAISQDNLKGRVTVLHFWDYRDEPLKEPYGQVGYLDFIHHRRQGEGLQVYGVMVDGRLSDEKTRAAAERSAKKLKSFMNLSYPILLDSGPVLKQFGDPRLLGAFPLFVVVGRDGKILHYHVGHYEVHQDRGLSDLDKAVAEALGKK